ncbi:MAG: hypothetical protein N2039_09060 [Gemmataceae bacterium]|nr:hypothetical protein [Gemmataceae bacterium]
MDVELLTQLFGTKGRWSGPCTVIIRADAHVQTIGNDAIVQGGVKTYSPRLITGRVPADHVMLLPDRSALLLIKRNIQRQATGEDQVQYTLQVVNTAHVAAVEFDRLDALQQLGVAAP